MGDAARALELRVETELLRAAPDSARALAERIRERCGDAALAVVFYGSCLRRQTDEGVLDFYVIVDSYRALYPRRALVWANALLPPNVFYLETQHAGATLRCKYAVLSADDFERGVAGRMLRPSIWARFCQPLLAVYLRDDRARELLVKGAARSVTTALERILPLWPAEGGVRQLAPAGFWQLAFRETYGYEMRPESPEAAAALYAVDAARFDAVTGEGLAALGERDRLELRSSADGFAVTLPAGSERARRSWRWRRPLAKAVYLLSLGKTAFTFGDWLPYALWKLERHSGTKLVPSARQRRHPLIFGWPLLFRALWSKALR